jgi:ubiquitin carboxyl-terminal hydrolase 7
MKSYIKCINVDYESSRVENFYGRITQLEQAGAWRMMLCGPHQYLLFSLNLDIQLNVKGCKTLRDSFANYIDVETLDGENKYQAEGHGLQVR